MYMYLLRAISVIVEFQNLVKVIPQNRIALQFFFIYRLALTWAFIGITNLGL